MNGDVLLDFDDLDRELGTPQVKFTAGGPHTVLAAGQLWVAGEKGKVRARGRRRGVAGVRADLGGGERDGGTGRLGAAGVRARGCTGGGARGVRGVGRAGGRCG
ncbi:hypothetical protein [Streptomyces armeniacus]|uniref:hypothetical protein n=1 Tax=Streptomyces armeniacus TaxID=83291 RepID=UPI001FEC03A3|nr:hypothetical protein [Streptomyces armeniacus]